MNQLPAESVRIECVSPPAVIPGGFLELAGSGIVDHSFGQPVVHFGSELGRLVFSSPDRLRVQVPAGATEGTLSVHRGGFDSPPVPFVLGNFLACELHPVTNPAIDSEGNILTTLSGPRGKRTPVSVLRIAQGGTSIEPYATGIMNATGLLARPDGSLLVSSRHNGTIYEVTGGDEPRVFAEGMGIATGLAMDARGNVYVGDRTGTIFKIHPSGEIFVFATLEPSVAAYHMAFGPDEHLYVTGPTTSSFDCVYRISPSGAVSAWRRGFGRPQGIAFDPLGRLHLCASYRGHRGVFRLNGEGDVEHVVSGQGIVGLAFEPQGAMLVATGESIYRIPRLD